MLNSHRHTRMPVSAISTATTAFAAPPDRSCPASTVRPKEPMLPESGFCCLDITQAAFFSGFPGLTESRVFTARRASVPSTSIQIPAIRLNGPNSSARGDRAEAGAGAQHHAERGGGRPAQDEHRPGPGWLARGESGDELDEADDDRPQVLSSSHVQAR